MEFDATDSKILDTLSDNSRLSMREISKKIGVSVATVMHRMKKLEESKAIKKYSVILDYNKLGYEIQALIHIDVSKGKMVEVEKKIATHPNVSAVYDITGHFDAVVLTKFKTMHALDKFIKKIQTYDFVEKTETTIILNTFKEEPLKV